MRAYSAQHMFSLTHSLLTHLIVSKASHRTNPQTNFKLYSNNGGSMNIYNIEGKRYMPKSFLLAYTYWLTSL